MSREEEKQLVQKWVNAVHAGQEFTQAEYDEFNEYLYHSETFNSFYGKDWPEFRQVDEFPFSATTLNACIEWCLDQELDDEDIPSAFRERMQLLEYDDYFHFLTEVVAPDGRNAWILVNCHSMGQAGVCEEIAWVFPTPLAAEESLRKDGYIFTGNTPSGKVDAFTDEQIIEMVRKAEESK
jgi:hypothetical protein